ncbi:nucleotidyltransferase family protein [Siccirubricoccus phaeus]|uniref:nucleotidyltransferase family protein n=1 Tax=Siccirubricoccus phaeus TaxID=2595053 RepID=UPI001A9C72A5|nr:sugar phosphate nucleotidyltransferase [Siccirubricoccus phaeus]
MSAPLDGVKAVILAGGRGTRLHPFTVTFPKPLMPLGDTPVVETILQRLHRFGCRDVTLTLGHLAELTRAYFAQRDQAYAGLKLRFVQEAEPTGTAGSLASVPELNSTFVTMNGDVLTDLDFGELMRAHRAHDAILTIATHQKQVKIDLGVLKLDAEGDVVDYLEKPQHNYPVSMGIYVYEPRVLKYIEPGKYLDFPDLVLKLLRAGEKVHAHRTECLWLDIGRPDDYARAQELHAEEKRRFDHV